MKIRFKRLHPDAILPTRATDGSAGFDLYADENRSMAFGEWAAISTGISVAIPHGWCGQIWPRSGLAVRFGIDRLAGLIDADYRAEVKAVLINHGPSGAQIERGDRIAQLVVVPCLTEAEEVDELDGTERGDGGFGSTGR